MEFTLRTNGFNADFSNMDFYEFTWHHKRMITKLKEAVDAQSTAPGTMSASDIYQASMTGRM